MKLKYLFLLPILGATLMGCDEIEYSDAKPVENPQLPGIQADEFSVAPATDLVNGINLDQLVAAASNPDDYMVELYTISVNTENLPADAVVFGGLEFGANDTFEPVYNVADIKTEDGKARVALSSLLTVRNTMFGKDPRSKTIYYRIPVYVSTEGGQYKLGEKDFFYCDGNKFQESGIDPGYSVEENYYLMIEGSNEFTVFNRTAGNVYDDPTFNLAAAFDANAKWKIVPESAKEAMENGDSSQLYGTSTPDALEGILALGGDFGVISEKGRYDIKIDMSTLKYTFTLSLPEWLGTPNDSQGWNNDTSQHLYPFNKDGVMHYVGFSWFGGRWGGKLATDAGIWCGIDTPMKMDEETGDYVGQLIVDGGGNILQSPNDDDIISPELYFINVDWSTLNFNMTSINSIGLVGNFNGWNEKEPAELTPASDNKLEWTGTVELDASGFKIVANHGWGINYGGSLEMLTFDGADMTAPAPGKYNVKLDLSTQPYSLTLDAQ